MSETNIIIKRCCRCQKEYPETSEFFRRLKGGFRAECKDCSKQYERGSGRSSGRFLAIRELKKHGFQRCPKCGEIKPRIPEYFNQDKRNGFSNYCKECLSVTKSEDYLKNVEDNRRKRREYSRSHFQAVALQQKRWQENNRDRLKANRKRHYDKNRNQYIFNALSRKHKERANGGSFTQTEIEELFEKQNGLCFYCWCDLSNGYVRDHWIPVSKGGDNWIDNIRLCCAACNGSKADKMPYEWKGRL